MNESKRNIITSWWSRGRLICDQVQYENSGQQLHDFEVQVSFLVSQNVNSWRKMPRRKSTRGSVEIAATRGYFIAVWNIYKNFFGLLAPIEYILWTLS